MEPRALVAAKLAEAGYTFFTEFDLDDIAVVYEGMIRWQAAVAEFLDPATEPATVFEA